MDELTRQFAATRDPEIRKEIYKLAKQLEEMMTREEIEEKMDELTRQFAATRDPEVREEIYRLAKQLEEMERE